MSNLTTFMDKVSDDSIRMLRLLRYHQKLESSHDVDSAIYPKLLSIYSKLEENRLSDKITAQEKYDLEKLGWHEIHSLQERMPDKTEMEMRARQRLDYELSLVSADPDAKDPFYELHKALER